LHDQGAALQAAKLRQDKPGRLRPGQDGARLGQEQGAGLGQLDAAADPVERKRCGVAILPG